MMQGKSKYILLLALTIASIIIPSTDALIVRVDAHQEECFYEDIGQNQPVNVMFQVTLGGFLDIDLKITSPDQRVIYEGVRETEGKYTFNTFTPGLYSFCFSNRMSTLTPKTVSFIITVGENAPKDVAKRDDITPLENSITQLAEGLSAVQAEQDYMKIREQAHRNTNESTNGRVLWWSVFEAMVLVAMSVWQIYYLRRFFEVKRVV
eukprot:TRINITY_DN448_c0_g1_i1.p1 TRINITY_DN448_c0_g1~~TRINITY_DN448_c0_g1_i1.p1  ORF type:complete len:207 (-),score=56.28 TRINITY_DN448_c0_g1_i1:71-691(-)